jgi:Endonuclease/Exonuclease/phosphatase family
MKIATFNINDINRRLANLLAWLHAAEPDVVCLQELKATDASFPEAAIRDAGYGAVWRGQKTWNGVAFLAKNASTTSCSVRRSSAGWWRPGSIATSGGRSEPAITRRRGLCCAGDHACWYRAAELMGGKPMTHSSVAPGSILLPRGVRSSLRRGLHAPCSKLTTPRRPTGSSENR